MKSPKINKQKFNPFDKLEIPNEKDYSRNQLPHYWAIGLRWQIDAGLITEEEYLKKFFPSSSVGQY